MTAPSRRPWLLAGLGLALAALAGQVLGQPPVGPPAVAPVTVKVERADGWTVEGTTSLTSLRLKTESVTSEVNTTHVRMLSVRFEDGVVTAGIELDDKTRMQGELLTEVFPVRVGDRTELLKTAELREVKFVKPKSGSFWALIFGLVTLCVMEVVLGVDNVIFLAIVAGKLPEDQRGKARKIGLAMALGTRLLLLFVLRWLIGLTRPLFTLPKLPFLVDPEARDVSVRDLILLAGGLFLIRQSVKEMHEKITAGWAGKHGEAPALPVIVVSFSKVVAQIALIDIIFSLDSVITAIGMVEDLWVMVVAMVVSMFVMLAFSKYITDFVDRNPTIKVLALSFLILIGVLLCAEALGQHIDKGYIYFAMAFAVVIELINMRLRPKPVADADKLA